MIERHCPKINWSREGYRARSICTNANINRISGYQCAKTKTNSRNQHTMQSHNFRHADANVVEARRFNNRSRNNQNANESDVEKLFFRTRTLRDDVRSIVYRRPLSPFRTMRRLVPAEPMSPKLRILGRGCTWSRASGVSGTSCSGNGKGGGLTELDRRVCWRTSSTQASPSGLIEICRERGLGPARPRGVD
jgi:hypothetical protein